MTMEEMRKVRFFSGIKFRLSENGPKYDLAVIDFDTGDCEDEDENVYTLDRIFEFCE